MSMCGRIPQFNRLENIEMNQELQYLRDEMNQRINFFYENSQKLYRTILLIWGGIVVLLGASNSRVDNMILYTLFGTILFISNLILYFSAQKDYDNVKQIFKIAAYILIFYEKRPSKTIKVGYSFCWETATFEIQAEEALNKPIKDRQRLYRLNFEYFILIALSIFGILGIMFYMMYNHNQPESDLLLYLLSILFIIYLSISLMLLKETKEYATLSNLAGIKIGHIKDFCRYSLKTGHYTEEEIKEKFGDFFQSIKEGFN